MSFGFAVLALLLLAFGTSFLTSWNFSDHFRWHCTASFPSTRSATAPQKLAVSGGTEISANRKLRSCSSDHSSPDGTTTSPIAVLAWSRFFRRSSIFSRAESRFPLPPASVFWGDAVLVVLLVFVLVVADVWLDSVFKSSSVIIRSKSFLFRAGTIRAQCLVFLSGGEEEAGTALFRV